MNPQFALFHLYRIYSIFALICFAVPLDAGEQPCEMPQLLAKYNFENIPMWIPNWGGGHDGSYKPAAGWKTPFRVKLDDENPHSGMHALRIEIHGASSMEKIVHGPAIYLTRVSSDHAAVRKVDIRLYVRGVGLVENGVGVRVLERDEHDVSIGLLDGETSLGFVPNSSEWIELRMGGQLHSRTSSITFMIAAYQSEVPATIWVDDISLELTTAESR